LKIALSNAELSENAARRLGDALRDHGYDLRTEILPTEGDRVEILVHQKGGNWLTSDRLGQLSNLRYIQTFSAGVDHINFEILPQNVMACGNVGAFAEPIAEHVLGMIIALGKRLLEHTENLRRGFYDHRIDAMFLKGKKIAILGAGGIGQAVARLAKSFGMITFGINTSGRPVENFDNIHTMSYLDELISNAEIVVISLPLSTKTKRLIDKKRLERMKDDSILINVARAEIVVEEDLYNHLKTHKEFRAGFDVWWERPKPDHTFSMRFPFFELTNFIGTPHVSGDVKESFEMASNSMVDNVIRYLENKPLKGVAKVSDYVGLKA
jgi:phosphoglycerate dehydrogenase-like enzyme